MNANEKKTKKDFVPIRGQDNPKLNTNIKNLEYQSEQNFYGITMVAKLDWEFNMKKVLKGTKTVLLFEKFRIKSTKLNAKLIFNVDALYVVPIVTYASGAWFVNEAKTKEIEVLQKNFYTFGSLKFGKWTTRNGLTNSSCFLHP